MASEDSISGVESSQESCEDWLRPIKEETPRLWELRDLLLPPEASEEDGETLDGLYANGLYTNGNGNGGYSFDDNPDQMIKDIVYGHIQDQLSNSSSSGGDSVSGPLGAIPGEKKPKQHRNPSPADSPHTCEICGKTFCSKNNVLRHLKIHTGEKPHMCNLCNKGFRDKERLQNHARIHTGEKPYECEVCAKTFRVKSHMKNHMKVE